MKARSQSEPKNEPVELFVGDVGLCRCIKIARAVTCRIRFIRALAVAAILSLRAPAQLAHWAFGEGVLGDRR
jgi:hypothetical protein